MHHCQAEKYNYMTNLRLQFDVISMEFFGSKYRPMSLSGGLNPPDMRQLFSFLPIQHRMAHVYMCTCTCVHVCVDKQCLPLI